MNNIINEIGNIIKNRWGKLLSSAFIGMALVQLIATVQHREILSIKEYIVPSILGFCIGVLVGALLLFLWLRKQQLQIQIVEKEELFQNLRRSEELFRGVIENSPTALSVKDLEGHFQLVNRKHSEWFGLQPEDVIGRTAQDITTAYSAEATDMLDRKVIDTCEAHELELDVPFADGTIHSLITTKFPILGPDSEITGVGTIHSDITERKHLEKQVHQAQKMEAVGQLTGGVAHDFNNMLGVMLGNAERLQSMFGGNDKAEHHIEEVISAINRSASLTHRLLAFSRQQTLSPTTTDVLGLVHGLEDMLRRTLGETIEVAVECDDAVWPATMDAHQFENALLNLAINARDAMPNGGMLTIASANVPLDETEAKRYEDVAPGDYVKVAVSDTGTGIDPEVLEKVFEPFYTTKEVGEGTGLGLSMVYGFAKQSKGHISISSEVGQGTTVELYLPRSHKAAE